MAELDEVVYEFLVESHENLDQLDADLVALEKQPDSPELVSNIFRVIHTVKGTCSFLGFVKLEALTHAGENLLSKLRDGALRLDADMTSALLSLVDGVRGILACIEAEHSEGDVDYSDVIHDLQLLADGLRPRRTAALDSPPATAKASPKLRPSAPPRARGNSPEHKCMSDSRIRVDVSLLDKLMNLVGELVLARNQMLQFVSTTADASFLATVQRLNLITTELQEGLMKTRMQPIGKVWGKFPRIVRDVSRVCGKQVSIEMEGEETELDRTLIEAITDPLTHIVRNSVGHGIETPEARVLAGKPAEGKLFLCAFHEGGQVNIEISDDGGGIDPQKIKAKAIHRGLLGAEEAGRMSDRELLRLIFAPGFSTAERITNVSGRGVGMDVVRTNIEKIGGTVDIQSQVGKHTTLRIKIPLTLAIIPALVVTSGNERFCIPQMNLLELLRIEGEQVHKRIEHIHGVPVYRLRGNLLPLVYLNDTLKLKRRRVDDGREVVHIVMLQTADRSFGLVVDEINDTEEIVVKPLGRQLRAISAYAGATIMGDGRVALILDVLGIARLSNVVNEVHERSRGTLHDTSTDAAERRQTLLLFSTKEGARMIVPLSSVARLEEFPKEQIEYAGNQRVVQYRNEILPLVELSDVLPDRRRSPRRVGRGTNDPDIIQVVVYTEGRRSVGVVVAQIIDIVDEILTIRQQSCRDGVLGVTVIQGRVTEVLDIESVVRRAYPNFYKVDPSTGQGFALA